MVIIFYLNGIDNIKNFIDICNFIIHKPFKILNFVKKPKFEILDFN